MVNSNSRLSSCSTPKNRRRSTKSTTNHLLDSLDDSYLAHVSTNILRSSDDFFGLPNRVKEVFHERGVTKLYDWQIECLNLSISSNGKNFVYSLPTSGGKTLVAEVLMLREILLNQKSVLFILPFISIVQEKVRSFTSLGLEFGFWVEEYAASRGRIPPVKRVGTQSVLIATIEKAHTIVNSLIDTKSLDGLGLVIVDELHMLGEGGSRGACLELVLTKLLIGDSKIRIVGMSATLSNISDITRFLNAQLYQNNFRPVKLNEYIKLDDHIHEIDSIKRNKLMLDEYSLNDCLIHRRIVNFEYNKRMLQRDPDHLVGLVAEVICGYSMNIDDRQRSLFQSSISNFTLPKSYSCLVFCPTKAHCENTAHMLAELLPDWICSHSPRTDSTNNTEPANQLINDRLLLLENLRLDNTHEQDGGDSKSKNATPRCCPVLEYTIPRGIAYHHSGLTQEERYAIEAAYNQGIIKVICCTSTLAAGVNLPARRVIIRKPYIGNLFISSTQYQQMTGRAGRAGLDDIGESITILQPQDRPLFAQLLTSIGHCQRTNVNHVKDNSNHGENPSMTGLCQSSLMYGNGKGLRQFLLSVIGLEIALTYTDIVWCCDRTFYFTQFRSKMDCEQIVRDELQKLMDMNLIVKLPTKAVDCPSTNTRQSIEKFHYQATRMGRAAIKGGIESDLIGPLINDLRLAARGINTSGPIHLLYLVSPPEVVDQIQIDWNIMFDRVSLLSTSESNLIGLLGFPEGYILWKATGQTIRRKLDERPLRRLYIALILAELWHNRSTVPIWHIAERYKFSRGALQSLLASAASIASSLAHALSSEFSTDTELWAFAQLLPEFSTRLAYCVSSELLPLMQLPGVKRARARQLYNVGYCTLKDIACASIFELTNRMAPYVSRRLANEMIQAAQMLVSEQASNLYQEAKQMLSGLNVKSILSQMAENFKVQPFSPKFTQNNHKSDNSQNHLSSPALTDPDEDLFA